jgi:hypothetical protein
MTPAIPMTPAAPPALSATLLTLFGATLAPQGAAPDESAPVRIEVRVSPAIDLYYEVRARAASGEEPRAADPLGAAVRAAAALDRELGSLLLWGPIDGGLADCRRAAELLAAFERLPETLRRRAPGEGEVALREPALALARALVEAEERWLAESWPERERELETQARRLAELLTGERGRALYRFTCDALRLEVIDLHVPVLLATRLPEPGAVTFRRAGGGGVAMVGIRGLDPSTLAEVVVHESLHALDLATAGQDTLFADLRRALAAAGLAPEERRARDAVHALFFFQAAEAVRRQIDPEHVDYGIRHELYPRLAVPALEMRELWQQGLEGELGAEELVERMVALLLG